MLKLLYIPCKDKKEARKIADLSIEKKFAACANIFPVISIFPWNGKLEDISESVLILKTNRTRLNELKQFVKKKHSYSTPCIIEINAGVNKEYENWLNSCLKN